MLYTIHEYISLLKGVLLVEGCIFCKIIRGEIPCSKVYEDDKILAFKDINPGAPIHVLIIPKKHISSLNDLQEEDSQYINAVHSNIKHIAELMGVFKDGYRVVVNCGEDGGQTVGHLHFHLLGGRKLKWPPG